MAELENIGKFQAWLTKKGAIIVSPTNQWEVLRFKTSNGVSVIYRRANGRLTFTGDSDEAYSAFVNNRTWKAVDRKRKPLREQKTMLAMRDGKKCFFHGERLGYDRLTVEHLLAVSHGGTDHPSNLCLACEPCNQEVGNMSITQKMLYRDKKLGLTVVDDKSIKNLIQRIKNKML